MTTRRPQKPIHEKGRYRAKSNWYNKLDTNGDTSLMIFQLVLAPVVIPYLWIRRIVCGKLKRKE